MPLYQLSEDDVRLLRELHVEKKNRRHGSPVQNQPLDDVAAPEVYLVWVPEAGIPAVNEGDLTGTAAADLADDVFSGTNCYCYRLNTSTGAPLPLERYVKVYNSGAAIEGNQWVIATRDKWGRWWAGVAPATQNEISFTVVTDCSFNTLTCVFTKTTSTITIRGNNLEVEVT